MPAKNSEGGGSGNVDEKDYVQTVADIREWLVRIDTNQTHQTELLKALSEQVSTAIKRAGDAEDRADDAYLLADKANEKADKLEQRMDDTDKEAVIQKRWLIGTIISVAILLLPIIDKLYG